ncbi:MAG: hypothetical protein AB8E15_00180 [Bdellovibrionales bacterium]
MRNSCPNCNKKLPLFPFTASRKRFASGDYVIFNCASCGELLKAISNEAHQKNFIWILLLPLFASPMIISLRSMVDDRYRLFYYLSCYALALLIPTIRGQHKMDFVLSSDEELDLLSNNTKTEKEN